MSVSTPQTPPTTASRLAAILAGKRGPVTYDFELWRSNKAGELLEKFDHVRGASVNLSNFRDHTWELTLPIGAESNIDVIEDFVKVIIKLWDSTIADWQSFPFGLYFFAAPSGEDSPLSTEYALSGKSLEAILMDSSFHLGYRATAGTGVLAAVRSILTGRGFALDRIDFPPSDKLLTRDFFADPFQDVESVRPLRVINGLLAAGGFYALYTDKEGKFRTKDIPDGPQRQIAVTYGTTDTSENLITDVSPWEIDDENFANSVVVQSGDAAQQFLIVRVENNDPNSRVSVQALQQAGRGDGRVQKEPIVLQQAVTLTEATQIAKAALRVASGMNVRRTINTVADPRRDARETYELEMYREDGTEVATGKWPVVGFNLDLDPQGLRMSHELHVDVHL